MKIQCPPATIPRRNGFRNFRSTFAVCIFAAFSLAATGKADQATAPGRPPFPRDPSRTINLGSLKGQSYLETMQSSGSGIFDKTNADDGERVTIATPAQIASAIGQCDPIVGQRIYGSFSGGMAAFQSIVAHIQGQSLSPQTIRATLQPFITGLAAKAEANIALDSTAALALLASGSGTLVQIDPGNCFYNVGYQSPIVESGRSFGATRSRAVLDASDYYYLNEVGSYLKPNAAMDTSAFYHAILRLLTNSDASGFAGLDPSGQTAATDFMTVYTAELDRHIMAGLNPQSDPWEIDIAEVTLLANYCAESGMVIRNGVLAQAPITAFASRGSIGESRDDFVSLATQITSFESLSANHPNLVQAIIDITPIQDPAILSQVKGDILRRFLVYMNRPEFQGDVQRHPSDLENAMASFLAQVRVDAGPITQYLVAAH